MRLIPPSRHVPRSHRIQFSGHPSKGYVEVRCRGATDFDIVRVGDLWVAVVPGEGFRSVLPTPPQPSAYLAYIAATTRFWKASPPRGIDERILYHRLKPR